MPEVTANGLKLHYDERGEGTPLLLIMGLGAQMTRWPEGFCDRLAEHGFRVIRFDNRDVGMSEKLDAAGPPDMPAMFTAIAMGQQPAAAYDLSDMARDAVGVLDALDIDKAHIVGASMGGMIAQLIAADYPERVLSLCSIMSTTGARDLPPSTPEAMALLSTPAPDPHTNWEGFLERGVYSAKVIGSPAYPPKEEDVRARTEADFKRGFYPVGFGRQYAAVLASPDRRAKLQTVRAPSIVIHGADDPLVPVEAGRDTAKHIPGAELVVVPGMGHDLPEPLWGEFVGLIVGNAGRAG